MRISTAACLALAIAFASGCEDLPVESTQFSERSRSVSLSGAHRGGYVKMNLPRRMASEPTTYAVEDPPTRVFLNRHGGSYIGFGYDDASQGFSSLVNWFLGDTTVSVPAFQGGDQVWNELVNCVAHQFSDFNLQIMDEKPTSGDFLEAVIGGHYSNIGSPPAGGMAPFDPYTCRSNPEAIVYVFSEVLGDSDAQALCEVSAQEIAHAFSLDHSLLCEDPMTYLSGCGKKTFQNVSAECGEYAGVPRACACNGDMQNSVAVLNQRVGPSNPEDDASPPTISLVQPQNGDLVGAQVKIIADVMDNFSLGLVELEWLYSDAKIECPSQSCSVSGDRYEWVINADNGERSFIISATDALGNSTSTELIDIEVDDTFVVDDNRPLISFVEPENHAMLLSDSIITVSATVDDESTLTDVFLLWDYTNGTFPCPFSSETVDCVVEDNLYTWTLKVTDGERSFKLYAIDAFENEAYSEIREISLSVDAPQPGADDDFEPNNVWEEGTLLPCGTGLEMVSLAGNDDWIRVNVPPETTVMASMYSSKAIEAKIMVGPLASDVERSAVVLGETSLSAVSETGELAFLVRNHQELAASYRMFINCEEYEDMVDEEEIAIESPVTEEAEELPSQHQRAVPKDHPQSSVR